MPDQALTRRYADGYRSAASILVKQILAIRNSPEMRINSAVYPIIYLYRHNFELLLKFIVVECRRELNIRKSICGHRLLDIWKEALPLIEKVFQDQEIDLSQNEHVTRLLQEFDRLDSNGEAARYPNSLKGERHFEELDWINVRHFACIAEGLSAYLDAIAELVEIEKEIRE